MIEQVEEVIPEHLIALRLVPISFSVAKSFVQQHHRHNKPPTGWKFGVGVNAGDTLVGIAMAGRPVARHFDDGGTLEVNRTCTLGYPNTNSMLYGAIWRAAKALGYTRCITYTQADEPGTSLIAAGWIKTKELKARKSWAESTRDPLLKKKRDPIGNGGVNRVLWTIQKSQSFV